MKAFLLTILLFWATGLAVYAQSVPVKATAVVADPTQSVRVVEASCGQCRFGLPGKSCDLAVRLEGKAYFVDGTTIDSHGDAHAKDGFCQTIRRAEVQGEVVDNRFVATYFRLLPETTSAK